MAGPGHPVPLPSLTETFTGSVPYFKVTMLLLYRLRGLGMGKETLGEFDEAHPLAIADDIAARTGRGVRRSAVYVTLQRLEQKGLITTRLGEPRAERGGKARRHVRVEAPGMVAVHESRTALERMWGDLDTSVEAS